MTACLTIAVASGKGGTGKTTVAVNLAACLAEAGESVTYVDCDVEEPNGHVFLAPRLDSRSKVSIHVPEVDKSRCTYCGACGKACRYSAILALPKQVLTFPKLCHGCGGCALSCPENAIREVPRTIGWVEQGGAGKVVFSQGKLNVGEAMAPPVIRGVLEAVPKRGALILDAPPGTSCPVIETAKSADVVLLVTEPTPFGLNDLMLAVEMTRALGLPFGVAINKDGSGNEAVSDYCAREGIPVLLRIPHDLRIARAYSRGEMMVDEVPEVGARLNALYRHLQELASTKPKRRAQPVKKRATFLDESPSAGLLSETVQLGRGDKIRELVVISGKGGTGKTSIVASFAALAGNDAVLADCDVDAADLHLVLSPKVHRKTPFSGGQEAVMDESSCTACGICAAHCRFEAILPVTGGEGELRHYTVDPVSCEGCGVCADICPERAISMMPSLNGEWFISDCRHGPMVHAKLGIAQENSGKLVSLVRNEAKALAERKGRDLVICDGSPGIGCPVIASIAGAHMVLLVTETSRSGLHDLKRVAELCGQMEVKAGVCINKADINPRIAEEIETKAAGWNMPVWGRIHHDEQVTAAQLEARSVVEHCNGKAARDIRKLWERVKAALERECDSRSQR